MAKQQKGGAPGKVGKISFKARPKKGKKLPKGLSLARAADLPSPAPPGSFLRQFGQSDRDQIEAASLEASVPQVLALLNGFLEDHVLQNPSALVMQDLEATPEAEERVELAYLSVLGRRPDLHERALWEEELAQGGEAACRDLVWTLINSPEFRFVQ